MQVQRTFYLDDAVPNMAFLFLLNPTPGIFQGDSLTISVKAEPETKIHLTTPSATKIYAMPEQSAQQTLNVKLEEGSYLEYLPEPLIPFKGARLAQRTWVNMARGTTLVLGEVVLPGRVAKGENFAFHLMERRLTVTGPDGRPLFHEASLLTPQTLRPQGRALLTPEFSVMGTLVIISPCQERGGLREQLRGMVLPSITDRGNAMIAVSDLCDGIGLVIKAVSKDSKTISNMFRDVAKIARRYFL